MSEIDLPELAYRGARERVIPSDGVSGCFFPAGPLSPAMPDLDSVVIENLLHEGALRRRITVNAYRDLVRAKADIAGIRFATALLVMAALEMPLGKRNTLFEQLVAIIEQDAARHGMSVGRFVKIMLCGDDGKSPFRQH